MCNFTEGGEGTVGYKHKDKTKKLFSTQRKGKPQTPAQYKANCNHKMSDEARHKIGIASKGHRYHSEYQMNILRNNECGSHKFKVIYPDKSVEEIKNLSKFCRFRNLDRTSCTKAATSNVEYKGYYFKRL